MKLLESRWLKPVIFLGASFTRHQMSRRDPGGKAG